MSKDQMKIKASSRYRLLIVLILLSSIQFLHAQDGKKAVLPSSEVDVIKEFDATLEDAIRMVLNPRLVQRDTISNRYTYTVSKYDLDIPYAGAQIKPLAMPIIPQDPAWPGYIKLGVGYPLSSVGALAYNFDNEQDFSIGGVFTHHAFYKGEFENQRSMTNQLKLDANYLLNEKIALEADLSYNLLDYYLYGYDDTVLTFTKEESLKRFYNPALQLKVLSPKMSESGWLYNFTLDLSRFADNQSNKENNYLGSLNVSKLFENKHQLDINIGADFTRYVDTTSQQLDNFYFNPAFTFVGDYFRFRAGASLVSSKDLYHLYPDANLSIQVLGNQLILELGAGGGLQKNNFESLSMINPYLRSGLKELRNTNFRNYYGRVKGVYKSFNYSVEGGYIQNNDFAFYQNDSIDTRYFTMYYDSLNIGYIQTQLQTLYLTNIEIETRIRYNFYSGHTYEKAWYLPDLEMYLSLRHFALSRKLQSYLEFRLQNPVSYDNFGELQQSTWLTDISLGADYYLFDQLAIFAQANNLLNNKFAQWKHYPSYGINFTIGLKSRF